MNAPVKKAAAKRPSLAKKHTRSSETNRKAALDVGARFELDGTVHAITVGDMTGLDARELRRQVGISFPKLLTEFFSDDSDLDVVAAILWLARYVNGGEKGLTYEEVLAEMDWETVNRIAAAPDKEEPAAGGDDGGPEA